MPYKGSSGKKIGTKMMMISLHSKGQPSTKISNCDSSKNCTGDRFNASMKSLTTCSPPR